MALQQQTGAEGITSFLYVVLALLWIPYTLAQIGAISAGPPGGNLERERGATTSIGSCIRHWHSRWLLC